MVDIKKVLGVARKRNKEENADTRKRFLEILSIVRKHNISDGLTPEVAVELLQDLGTTFVKLGQIASTHPDVLPQEYCEALGSLRTSARPLDFQDIAAQVETELGKPIGELFDEFDETPLGSASIAQVHKAKLLSGEVVAVKVQRPGVVDTVTEDLAILEQMVDIYGFVNRETGGLSLKELVAELVKTSMEELDFLNEAAHLDRFYANNEPRANVASPKCYREYTTSAILTEDFVDAPAAEQIDSLGKTDKEREALGYLIANNYMQQMMEDGFYHADPHAGNVLLPEEGGIEWIDFGMMGTMTSAQRDILRDLIFALVKGDNYALKRALLKVATPTGPVDHAKLLEFCENLTSQFIDVNLEDFDTGALVSKLVTALQQHGFDIDPFLTMLGRGLTTLEGTIHLVAPTLSIMKVLVDYLQSDFSLERIKRTVTNVSGQAFDSAVAMAALPSKAADTLDMVQKGHVKIGMELSSTEQLASNIRASAGLIAFGLIIMGLVVGACVLDAVKGDVLYGSFPFLGLAALVVGVVFGIFVLVKTWPFLK